MTLASWAVLSCCLGVAVATYETAREEGEGRIAAFIIAIVMLGTWPFLLGIKLVAIFNGDKLEGVESDRSN